MKRKIIGALFFALILCFSASVYASVDGTYEVAVINTKGNVQVDPQAEGSWISPWIGMKLKKESVIKTGQDSFIEVVFDEDGLNVLKIKENTLITIQKARVDLNNGSVLAAFANFKRGSTFSVKTPTAVCGIRGSGMGVDFINNMTVVSAFEHSVYVQGIDSNGDPVGVEVVIPEGWETRVREDGDSTPPAELTENEKKVFEAWVAVVKSDNNDQNNDDADDGDDDDDDNDQPDNKDLEEVKKDEEKPDISPNGEGSSCETSTLFKDTSIAY